MPPSSSNGSSTLADFPFESSERKFALLSQTSLPPPKNGSVCSAAMVERIAVVAPSTLSAAPSIISSPNSPASAGASCLASSAASRFTLASSEPTIARIFSVAALLLALGTAVFFARAGNVHKIGVFPGSTLRQSGSDLARRRKRPDFEDFLTWSKTDQVATLKRSSLQRDAATSTRDARAL